LPTSRQIASGILASAEHRDPDADILTGKSPGILAVITVC
jgi:hypothetical protein